MFSNEKKLKKTQNYVCEKCDFNTCNKNDYMRHIKTKKHILSNPQCFSIEKTQKNATACACGKIYKDHSGLWRHKKKCGFANNTNNIVTTTVSNLQHNKDDLIIMLIKQNSELIKETTEFKNMMLDQQNIMMKVIENGTNNTTTNNTINSHNKAFNLQFFLNETCKDAMNINEFIDSIQLQLSDLEKMEEIGFVEGISNIIIKNLNALDVCKRPIHCTDKKRETIYIKDQGVWEKDVENTKIRGLVKKVAGKNSRLLHVFKEKHPDYNQYHSKYSTQYNKLVIEAFGGKGDNDLEKEDKIIRNITKTIVVEK